MLSIVAPEIADAHDAAWLARQEALAHRDASLTLFDDGQGRCHGKFTVPSSVGEQLKAHLLALAAPARHHDQDDDAFTNPGTGEVQPLETRLGKAMVEYVTRYPVEKLPNSGGVNASVLVRMNYDTLIDSIAPRHYLHWRQNLGWASQNVGV